MIFFPKKTKYKKYMKRSRNNKTFRGSKIVYFKYGFKCLNYGYINSKQIESARIAVNKIIKNNGKFVIRIFPDKILTKKPIEVRMGNGKGDFYCFVFKTTPGRIIFEVECQNLKIVKKAHYLCNSKLPIKTKLVYANYFD
ncbi:50S ribosomal protein L16 [Candidatus Vidania fulgoroideorum]